MFILILKTLEHHLFTLNNKVIFLFIPLVFLLNLTQIFSASPDRISPNTIIEIGDELQILLKEDPDFLFRGTVDASGNITLDYLGEIGVVNFTLNELKAHLEKLLLEQFYNKVTLSVGITKQSATRVYIYGSVNEPGAIELPNSGRISISQALATVKGLTSWANPKGAYILRSNQSGGQTKEPVDIQAISSRLSQKGLVLSPKALVYLYAGDELYIPGLNQSDDDQVLTTAPKEVIVVGQVSGPGIILFAPGEEATLMRAIFKSGGLTQFAQGNKVKLLRYKEGKRIVQIVDLNRVIENNTHSRLLPK